VGVAPGKSRPTVVQFGAGAIGRGFVGQLWAEAGYEVVFVDLDPALISSLNERGEYPLRLVSASGERRDLAVSPVRALNGRDREAVADELARCAFACTAAGVGAFRSLAPTLAAGIVARARARNGAPLNLLCCENLTDAGAHLRDSVAATIGDDPEAASYFADSVGFVDASVGRMVPPPTPELRAEDPLLVLAEPYAYLPIDATAWVGPLPAVAGLQPRTNFAGYIARKLFTHNGGHALLAYEGYRAGHEFIYQAVEDVGIGRHLDEFWRVTGAALIAAYGFDPAEQRRHEADLRERFTNRALADTVVRVARDPIRKLGPEDRFVGAARLCARYTPDVSAAPIARAIAAALRYDSPDDPGALALQAMVMERGIAGTVEALCGLPRDSALSTQIGGFY
jgi:mannitol-1-phosphate 5-dehydrogenase